MIPLVNWRTYLTTDGKTVMEDLNEEKAIPRLYGLSIKTRTIASRQGSRVFLDPQAFSRFQNTRSRREEAESRRPTLGNHDRKRIILQSKRGRGGWVVLPGHPTASSWR